MPLLQRKRLLLEVMPRIESRVRYVDHIHEAGVRFFELACERDLEGIVAKYARGVCQTNHPITSWLKVKNPHYSQAEGRAELFEQRRSPEPRSRKPGVPILVLA